MKRAAVALITLILLVSSLAAQPPSGVPSSLQLVEATVPQLQLALQSRLITSEQLVKMYDDCSANDTRIFMGMANTCANWFRNG